MRQIDYFLKAINKRDHSNFKINAALHGVPMKEDEAAKYVNQNLSEEQEDVLDQICPITE